MDVFDVIVTSFGLAFCIVVLIMFAFQLFPESSREQDWLFDRYVARENRKKKRKQRKKERLLYKLRKMGVKVLEVNDLEKVQNRNDAFYNEIDAKWDIKRFLQLRYSDEISLKTIDEIAEKIAKHYSKRRGKGDLVSLEELIFSKWI